MTSIPEISARGSLILWAKFQIPVGPRSGREGENCRPLDHMRQIPFINQAPFAPFLMISLCIYTKLFQLCLPFGIFHCVLKHCTFIIYACALLEAIIKSFCPLCDLCDTYWYGIGMRYSETLPSKLDIYALQCSVSAVNVQIVLRVYQRNSVKLTLIDLYQLLSNGQVERSVQTFTYFFLR